tara:strand:- start:437 stop:721 length:285 start_codon:yes stop_codon:yes gene_type:complete
MPTEKKRIGYLPRRPIKELIAKLSEEQNISQSKIVGILVEEALIARGVNIPLLELTNNNNKDKYNVSKFNFNNNKVIYDDLNEMISDSGVTYKK